MQVLQPTAPVMVLPGDNATFLCSLADGLSMTGYTMAWYRQASGGAPVEFLMKENGKATEKLNVDLVSNKICLHVSDLNLQDSGSRSL